MPLFFFRFHRFGISAFVFRFDGTFELVGPNTGEYFFHQDFKIFHFRTGERVLEEFPEFGIAAKLKHINELLLFLPPTKFIPRKI